MKIGLITFQDSMNYGAALQTYALWHYITGKGHYCEVIRLLRPPFTEYQESTVYHPLRKVNKRGKKTLLQKIKYYLKNGKINEISQTSRENFSEFREQINHSRYYYGVDDLCQDPPQYDLYVTGSDQVWNPSFGYCLEPYFLSFAPESAVKISYAASIGIESLRDNEKDFFKKYLSSYTAISVRETTAQKLLQDIIKDKSVEQVCDPCQLLKKEDWAQIAILPKNKKKFILYYEVGSQHNIDLMRHLGRICKTNQLDFVYIGRNGYPFIKYKDRGGAGPREFLGYIQNAEVIISNSFHATLFSLLFEKNFFVYIPKGNKRGSRMRDLLLTYGLSNHLLPFQCNWNYDDLKTEAINYEKVHSLIDEERNRSKNFLDIYL